VSIDLEIDVSKEGGVTTISVLGELDDFHAPKLKDAFSRVIDKDDCKKVLLDLRGATFIDSVGLGMIAIAGKKIIPKKGQIRLICDNPQLTKLITTSGILDTLKEGLSIQDSLEKALETF